MLVFKEKEVRELAPLPRLIEALRVAFRNDHGVGAGGVAAGLGAPMWEHYAPRVIRPLLRQRSALA